MFNKKNTITNLDLSSYTNDDLKFLISLAYLYDIKKNEIGMKISKDMLNKKNLKKVYKEKAKILHPDKETGDNDKFQELNDNKQFIFNYLKNELFNSNNVLIKNINCKDKTLVNYLSYKFNNLKHKVCRYVFKHKTLFTIYTKIKNFDLSLLLLLGICLFVFALTHYKDFNKDVQVVEKQTIETQTKVETNQTPIIVKEKTIIESNVMNYKDKNIDLSLLYKFNKLFIVTGNNVESKKDFLNIITSEKYNEYILNTKSMNVNSLSKIQINNINTLIKLGVNNNELSKYCLSVNKQIESLMKSINPKKTLEYSKKQEMFDIEYSNLSINMNNSYTVLNKELSIPKEDDFIMNLQNEILKFVIEE